MPLSCESQASTGTFFVFRPGVGCPAAPIGGHHFVVAKLLKENADERKRPTTMCPFVVIFKPLHVFLLVSWKINIKTAAAYAASNECVVRFPVPLVWATI